MPASTLEDLLASPVRLAGYRLAAEVIPGVGPRSFLHSGPPLRPGERLPGALRGALTAGLLFEGEAATAEEAAGIVEAGGVALTPCQQRRTAGPLTGVVTPRTAVLVAEREGGERFYAPVHEGDHGGMRTGMFDPPTVERLRLLADVVAPTLDEALRLSPPIDITAMQASGLHRGDECHNRNIASTSALLMALAPAIAKVGGDRAARTFAYFADTPQHFISLSVAAAKATADAVHACGPAGIVTGVGMNGREFGIRVSGLDGWFTAPSPTGPMVSLDGGDITRAAPGEGDSPMIESIGLGAFALSGALGLAHALGRTAAEASALVAEMRRVTAAESPVFRLPCEDFRGTPAAIDVRKVVAEGVEPATTLGFMHREPGRGRVGVGIMRMPMAAFELAAAALDAAEGAADA
ncbi:hypothetical protein GCM10017673_04210 [Streptosporangium violaceochromogenes]|nr:hypothetical protein GCM10017673_04210 [Streptosporangium violaceochromogenes]